MEVASVAPAAGAVTLVAPTRQHPQGWLKQWGWKSLAGISLEGRLTRGRDLFSMRRQLSLNEQINLSIKFELV